MEVKRAENHDFKSNNFQSLEKQVKLLPKPRKARPPKTLQDVPKTLARRLPKTTQKPLKRTKTGLYLSVGDSPTGPQTIPYRCRGFPNVVQRNYFHY